MNKYERKKVEMYKAVIRVMELHAASRSSLPVLEEKYMLFKEKSDSIDELLTERTIILEGVRQHKDRIKQEASALITKVAGALQVYAQDQKMDELFAVVNFGRKYPDGLSGANFLTLLNVMVGKLTDHIQELTQYGATQADLDELQVYRDELSVLFFASDQAILEGKSVNSMLREQVRETGSMLKNFIDPLMNQFSTVDPEFFIRYKNARKVHKAPVHKKKNDSNDSPDAGEDLISNAS